jgi:hypothetical protein
MKYFLFLFFFCFFSLNNNAFAQLSLINKKGTIVNVDSTKWTLSGTNIFNKNTGNVGIGNSSPTYKLDVLGKARVSDSFVANTARFLVLNSGSINDSIVVADPITGVFKRIAPIQLNKFDSTTAITV